MTGRLRYNKLTNGYVTSVLKWDREWQEYIVTTKTQNGDTPTSTYHTDDLDDALTTQRKLFDSMCEFIRL